MAPDDLCLLDLVETGRRVQARQLSSVQVTQAVLDRIERFDGRLKSYVTLTADVALAEVLPLVCLWPIADLWEPSLVLEM